MGKFLTDVDLNQNELQYAVIQNLNTDPIVSTTGQIYYNANISKLRLKTLAGWVTISTGTITIPTLQQVVDSGNSISNFGGIGTADILSVNFTNNRSLYLNNSSSPTIKIVDNLNASHYTIFDIDTLNLNGAVYNWSSIVNPATSPLSALPFTTDHLTATNNQYIIGDLVWYLGNVYRCIANNDSLLPTNTSYWTNLGIGYSLVQQPSDWNATSGNNQILNKPTIPSVTPAALTKTDDTNVILTLGGTPTTALLQGVSLTVGWTGTLADARIASAAYWNAKQNAITTGTTLQYFRGDLSLATFPTIPTVGTWGALNYPTWTTGTPFVKMTAAGTFALDTTTYTPASRTLTINGTTFDLTADRTWTISSPGGLPTGGTAGQILTKVDATDYNATWQENYADWTSVVKHTVKNDGTGLITKGTAVYVTGANGTNMLVGKASNTSEATSSKTMGLMQSDITTTGGTQTGFVVTEGLLSGLNTAGQTAGDPVWLGVNGALIYGLINKPYAPAHLVFIGIVTKVSAGSGEIFVKVQNGFELKEIHDVDLISNAPTNNQLLTYESATSLWKNKTIVEDAIVNGVTDKAPSQNAVFDALQFTRQLIVSNSTGSVTGTTAETIISSMLVPANTLDAVCDLFITFDYNKNTANPISIKLYYNTTNSLSGATQISLYTTGSFRNGGFNRKFVVKGTNMDLITAVPTVSLLNNQFTDQIFGASTVITIAPTGSIYFIFTVANDAVGTTFTNKRTTVEKMKLT